ncbi:hypothetical protein ISF_00281 [Cordyceps fumosorosea ARSEF 2679]|uniref:Uncharacterized protein n=1 Tax=Cordyceps fumosorosea (strain ARSEF 2679) TaxID=1081104 RepID=A0A168E4Y4_CORFA|nr:hypothetical protein ISF_00281 [Cordyceps fumosorosea ARSEF 2679]OAA73380.1 hypothetical protein ISF_00281 [Cordyceps fumosorosea ARSEF 2679]
MPALHHRLLDVASATTGYEARGMAAPLPRSTAAEDAFRVFAIEAWTLLAVAMTVTALRIALRISMLGIRNLRWDDYLVSLGTFFYLVETILAYNVGNVAHGLANSGMTEQDRAALAPDNPEYRLRVIGSKIQVAGWTTYGTVLWLYKTCMLIFYTRLTSGLHKSYKKQIYFGFALLGTTFIQIRANSVARWLSARAFDPDHLDEPRAQRVDRFLPHVDPGSDALEVRLEAIQEDCVDNTIHLWRVHHYYPPGQDPINGPQAAGAWSVRESCVATVVTNLPIIFPRLKLFFDRHVAPILSLRSSKSGHSATGFRTIGGGDGQGGAGPRLRRHPPQSVNPLPTKLTVTNFTVTESAEQLVGIELQGGSGKPEGAETGEEQRPSTWATTTATTEGSDTRDTEAVVSGSSRRGESSVR